MNVLRRKSWLWPVMATLLIAGWSSGFVGIRFANREAGVFLVLFWRTLLSGMIRLPLALVLESPMRWGAIRPQIRFGVMPVFFYLGGFALAIEQRVPTGLVALIADLLIVSFAGLSPGSAPLCAYGLTATSMLVFALASVLLKGRKSLRMPVLPALCIHSLTGAVLFAVCRLAQGCGMAWLKFIATFATYAIYYASRRMVPAAR